MKQTPIMFLAYLAAQATGQLAQLPKMKSKPSWRPQFTEAELELVRSLPKKEREKLVAELRAKYLQIETNKEQT